MEVRLLKANSIIEEGKKTLEREKKELIKEKREQEALYLKKIKAEFKKFSGTIESLHQEILGKNPPKLHAKGTTTCVIEFETHIKINEPLIVYINSKDKLAYIKLQKTGYINIHPTHYLKILKNIDWLKEVFYTYSYTSRGFVLYIEWGKMPRNKFTRFFSFNFPQLNKW